MKKLLILIFLLGIQSAIYSQVLMDLDEVTPLKGELAAIKKANQWAFINKEGEIVINFRNDLVLTDMVNSMNQKESYPIFKDGRCLIRKLKGNTYYYGFINEKGFEIIKPEFLNATNFSNGYAIIAIHNKDSIGFNNILKLPIMNNYIEEYVIDTAGKRVKYLYNPRNPYKLVYKKGVPIIESKFIAPNLVASKVKNNKWEIHQF